MASSEDDSISHELRQQGLRYCRQFLGGAWSTVSINDFHMRPIKGGLSNLLYCCELSKHISIVDKEPRSVLLRLYGEINKDVKEHVLNDTVVFTILSEKKIGPKLFGVFPDGRLEEFIASRHLRTSELHKPEISVACARLMAHFHKLEMPTVKEPTFDLLTRFTDDALRFVMSDNDDEKRDKLEQIKSFNLAEESQTLANILRQVDSPVVFGHNDLQEGNILFVETPSGWHVRPIDFEYSRYNYRGFDIGNHFCEWVYNYDYDQPPYFIARQQDYPSREQQLLFIRAYLEASCHTHADPLDDCTPDCREYHADPHTEEQILFEANVFALAADYLNGVGSIIQSYVSSIRFGYLELAFDRLNAYFERKQRVEQWHQDVQVARR